MHFTFQFLFLLVAFVCFGLSALGVSSNKLNIDALGCTFFVLSFLVMGR